MRSSHDVMLRMPAATCKLISVPRLEKIVGILLVAERVQLHRPYGSRRTHVLTGLVCECGSPLLQRHVARRHRCPVRLCLDAQSGSTGSRRWTPFQTVRAWWAVRALVLERRLLVADCQKRCEEKLKIPRAVPLLRSLDEVVAPVLIDPT